jgi:hypothetical protein
MTLREQLLARKQGAHEKEAMGVSASFKGQCPASADARLDKGRGLGREMTHLSFSCHVAVMNDALSSLSEDSAGLRQSRCPMFSKAHLS